ncbi:pirin family protein [Gelidibacter pelagius]|uniref:Pirin family protein n=1 Tax=Gelidibacter pelagius TaxID=2819985 RepID=A0ABS3SVC3_9FLAO|nr:pirin family protein [Gelidibacter pelagius]MBO3099660.1 pirin family protein [Gelidibacter pelagius]
MKIIHHKADTRGNANHGWLKSRHTFSFANYHNPERMNFGVLRVLNDDIVSQSQGFGSHPHRDMEIISIPLEGDLKHKDNMGNETIIKAGDIQVMSAGTGVMHSEFNNNPDQPVKFLQIWVIPNKMNVEPRYGQITVADNAKPNDFQQIVSPNKDDEGVWIHQDAWFHLAKFDQGVAKEYKVKQEGNGVYVFVLEGKAKIGDQVLEKRDGLGISDTDSFKLEALENSEILLMEVPMSLPQ